MLPVTDLILTSGHGGRFDFDLCSSGGHGDRFDFDLCSPGGSQGLLVTDLILTSALLKARRAPTGTMKDP